jgi:adenylosuccinate synthase
MFSGRRPKMPTTIVVGGQFGSEGKGKVTALTASLLDEPWVVRCGGPNSGHTTNVNGKEVVLRQLPAAAGHPNARLFLSAGCAVSEEILIDEIDRCGVPADRVVVDPRAVLVTTADIAAEQDLAKTIGSTASGTGAALVRRMLRGEDVRLAKHSQRLAGRVTIDSVAPLLRDHLDRDGHIIVEGTQGFGLSLLHSPHYPFVTSRDTTELAFANEVGISWRRIEEVVMVIRTLPIRVGGPSGPLNDEITWEEVKSASTAPQLMVELTSVTRRIRRVGRFDLKAVKDACSHIEPTALAIMGLDRLHHANYRVKSFGELSIGARRFIAWVSKETGVPVRWVGTGPATFEALELRATAPL